MVGKNNLEFVKEISNKLFSSIKNVIESFMHLSSYDKLLHELMNKFTKNESNKKIKKINDFKYSSKRINDLKEIIDKLDKLEKNDFIKKIIKGYEDLIEFINKDRKVRIALLDYILLEKYNFKLYYWRTNSSYK